MYMKKTINLHPNPKNTTEFDWESWLNSVEEYLKNKGYIKYKQDIQSEDFSYWKSFRKKYQIGLLFYDFRKYAYRDPSANRIGIMFKCMFVGGDRIDLDVSKDISLAAFEKMSKDFYNSLKKYQK